MAVTELLETRRALAPVGVALTAPVLNRTWPKRFTATEAKPILARRGDEPLVAAARLAIAARREAEHHLARLKRDTGRAAVALAEQPAVEIDRRRAGRHGADAGAAAGGRRWGVTRRCRADRAGLERLLAQRLIICVGTGGVGKTTTAAALALAGGATRSNDGGDHRRSVRAV
jgi:Mrp family chromosome partitioning ATPase